MSIDPFAEPSAKRGFLKALDDVQLRGLACGATPVESGKLRGKERGHGQGYKYPHDFPGHHTPQEYMPNPVRFYEPTEQGDEKRIADRLKSLRG